MRPRVPDNPEARVWEEVLEGIVGNQKGSSQKEYMQCPVGAKILLVVEPALLLIEVLIVPFEGLAQKLSLHWVELQSVYIWSCH